MKITERRLVAGYLGRLKKFIPDERWCTILSYFEDCFWDDEFYCLKQNEIDAFEAILYELQAEAKEENH